MTTITPDNKALAKYVAAAFKNAPSVREYLHDDLPLKVDLLSAIDVEDTKLIAYSTIGLSDTSLKWGDGEFPTRIELCALADSSSLLLPNVIASAAFNIMRTGFVCRPGSVMQGYVAEYYPNSSLRHLYFTSPFLWEEQLKALTLPTKKVSWLLCFPISDAENDFLSENGEDEFESLLESTGIDIYDLDRPSACP